MLDNLIAKGENIYQLKEEGQFLSDHEKYDKNHQQKQIYQYSKRSLLNILLIIFCTFEVVMITNTKVYIDSSMVRSFLTFYADQDQYPEIFDGLAYYIYIQDVGQLQEMMKYMLVKMSNCHEQTRNNLNFSQANISLHVQYHAEVQKYQNQTTYPINLSEGILQPFDLANTTDLQLFLLKTHFFEIVVEGLQIKNQGLDQRYIHRINFYYDESSRITVNYFFNIDNIISNTIDYDLPQAHELLYLRIFYLAIIFIALITFYYHALYVRRTFKELYTYLQHRKHKSNSAKVQRRGSIFKELNMTEINEIDRNIKIYVESRNLDINNLKWKDYMRVVTFDVIFAMLASFLQIISNFYLIFGREHEKLIGLGCLFAWLTLFRILQRYQKLTLMYELIKLSIISIIQFSASFFILFLGFTFLGTTIFPKVCFFASISDSVTTLFSMMAGDSIRMITIAIAEKYSSLHAICYIFSYVIMFMHAIHNTLTSIIKEYFILRKIDLVNQEKQEKGEQAFLYIEEIPIQFEKQKQALPLKLTYDLQKELFKIKNSKDFKALNKYLRELIMRLEKIILTEKMDLFQHGEQIKEHYYQNLEVRLTCIEKCISQLFLLHNTSELKVEKKKTITNEQL